MLVSPVNRNEWVRGGRREGEEERKRKQKERERGGRTGIEEEKRFVETINNAHGCLSLVNDAK